MQNIDTLKRRVSQLEDQLSRQKVEVEVMRNKLDLASGPEYDQTAEDLAVALMKVDIMQASLDKTRSDVQAEETEMKSPEYKLALKKMTSLKADADKLSDDIIRSYGDLRSLLDNFYDVCQDYDRLNRQFLGADGNTWLMSSYGWSSYLYRRISRITREVIK